jgi:hypothetical protein
MSELTIWINGNPKVFELDQPNPPSDAQVSEIKKLFLSANPNWGKANTAPTKNTGRIGYQGSRISGTLPGTGNPGDTTPLDPMVGFGIQDQVTKQPVGPNAVKESQAALAYRAAQGDPTAQLELIQQAGGKPQKQESAADVAKRLTSSPIPQKQPPKPNPYNLREDLKSKDVIGKAAKDIDERTKAGKNPLKSGELSTPLTGERIPWVQTGVGYEAQVGGITVKGGSPKSLIDNIKKHLKTEASEAQTRAMSPNVAAYEPSNDMAISPNVTPQYRLHETERERQEKRDKALGKAAETWSNALSVLKGDLRPLFGMEQDAVSKFVSGLGPEAATSVAKNIDNLSRVGNSNFTAEEQWGAAGNFLGDVLTAEVGGKSIMEGLFNALKKGGSAFDDALKAIEPKIGRDATEKLAQIKNFEPKELPGYKPGPTTLSEAGIKPMVKAASPKTPSISKKVEPASVATPKPTEIIESAPIATVPASKKPEVIVPAKPEAPKIEPKIEPVETKAQSTKPPAPTESSKGKTIGTANQVEFRMAEEGRIDPIKPGDGRKFGEAQSDGKKAVESGAIDPGKLVDELQAKPRPISSTEVGAILEGARRKEVQVNALLDAAKGKSGQDLDDAYKLYEDAKADLTEFLQRAQKGKTELSDAFRALQEGVEVDTGNLAQVIQRKAERLGLDTLPTDSPIFKKLSKEVDDLHAQIKSSIPDYDPTKETVEHALSRWRNKVGNVDRAKAEVTLRNMSRPQMSRKTPEQLQKIRSDAKIRLASRLAKVGSQASAGPGQAFTDLVASIPEIVDDLKIIVKSIAEEFKITTLNKVLFDKVREDMPGVDISDDDIVRALAGVWDDATAKRPPSAYEQLVKGARQIENAPAKAEKQRLLRDQAENRAKIKAEELRLKKEAQYKANVKKTQKDSAAKVEADIDSATLRSLKSEQKKIDDRIAKIADQDEQLETGGFWESVPKIKKLTKYQERLDLEIRLKQDRIRNMIRERDMSTGERALRTGTSLVRASTLGSDVGVLARQGMRAWTKPGIAVKNVGKAFNAALSDANLLKIQDEWRHAEIDGRLAEPLRRKAGLSTTTHFGDQEEFSLGRVFQWLGNQAGKVPGETGQFLKRIPGALDRFQSAFINGVRNDFFDYGIKKGWSAKELEDRAKYINSVFGRSNAKSVHPAMQIIFTSPRYERSRWESLWRVLRDPAVSVAKLGKDRAANEAVKELAIMTAEVYGIVKLAELAGFETNLNPWDKEFGIMRRGDETWDISAGLGPRFRDIIKIFKIGDKGNRDTIATIAGRGVSRAISPGTRIPVTQAHYIKQRAQGVKESDIKDPFSGFEPDAAEKGYQTLFPLIFRNTKQALEEQGLGNAMGVFLKEFVGTSVNRYPSRNVDPLGRPLKEDPGNKKYLDELKRIGIEGKLADKESGQTDEYQARVSREAGDAALAIVKPIIDSPMYKSLTKTQKFDLLKKRISDAKSRYFAPSNAREKISKAKDKEALLSRERAGNIK